MAVLQGAGYGAAVGGAIVVAKMLLKGDGGDALELGVATKDLENRDPALVRVLLRFRPLRDVSERSKQLYDILVASCDFVVDAELRGARGAEQFKASRAGLQATSAAKALCREAAKPGPNSMSDAAFDAHREIETVEAMLANHLHNLMLPK